jgi:hypothetical protein
MNITLTLGTWIVPLAITLSSIICYLLVISINLDVKYNRIKMLPM